MLSPSSSSSSLCCHGICHGHCIVIIMSTQGMVVVVGLLSSLSHCHCHHCCCAPHCCPPYHPHPCCPPPCPHCHCHVTMALSMCISLLLMLAWSCYHHYWSGWVSGVSRVMELMRSGGDHCLSGSGGWMNIIITDYNRVSVGGSHLWQDLWDGGNECCCHHVVAIVMDQGGGCGSGGWGWWVVIVVMLHCGCKWVVSVTT